LGQQLGGQTLKQISGVLNADEKTTGNAISAALPTLLGALSRNASRPEGAQALHSALAKDHDGSVLDNLAGFLGNPQAGPGDGILRHVLGGRRQRVENGLSKSTGLDAGSVSKLLVTLAPMVMGALGKTQRSRGMDTQGLSQLLDGERREVEKRAPQEMGLIGKLLDADSDGDVDFEDIAKRGLGALGGLLGGR
jgi:hypothetical protein